MRAHGWHIPCNFKLIAFALWLVFLVLQMPWIISQFMRR
jgi:hypothetical protein